MIANRSYDCLVIGAGPAGSTAACIVAEQGLSTLMIERDKFPREHVGESLMPEAYWIFERLGLEGELDDILSSASDDESREDYLLIRLLDTHAIMDALGKLRTVYPNVLQLERPALAQGGVPTPDPDLIHRHKAELPMVQDFYQQMTGDDLKDDGIAIVRRLLEKIHRGGDD